MTALLPVDGPGAPPRSNGELVFAAPWESRAFGMAVTLHEAGLLGWDDFRSALVRRIAEADGRPGAAGYYQHWLAALEDTLDRARAVSRAELDERARALAHLSAGHDHSGRRPVSDRRSRGSRAGTPGRPTP